jgi:hypothetical protein
VDPTAVFSLFLHAEGWRQPKKAKSPEMECAVPGPTSVTKHKEADSRKKSIATKRKENVTKS